MHVVDACHRLHLDFTARTLHDKRWREGYDALGARVAAATAQYVPSSDLSFATAIEAFEKRAQRGAISRDLGAISARSRRVLGDISARSRLYLRSLRDRPRLGCTRAPGRAQRRACAVAHKGGAPME